jgi:hypothetical protein
LLPKPERPSCAPPARFGAAIGPPHSVGKPTQCGGWGNPKRAGTFHPPAAINGSEAMYLGIGGLVLLIIILIILFR